MHALDERRQSELREAAEAHAGELARDAPGARAAASPTRSRAARDQHMRKMQALEESHADLKAGMQQRHAQQLEEIKKEHGGVVAEYDAALAQRDQLITEGHDAHRRAGAAGRRPRRRAQEAGRARDASWSSA